MVFCGSSTCPTSRLKISPTLSDIYKKDRLSYFKDPYPIQSSFHLYQKLPKLTHMLDDDINMLIRKIDDVSFAYCRRSINL